MPKNKENVRKVTTTGKTGTYYVTLPKEIMRHLSWRKGQKVIVERKGKKIVIRDWKE